MIPKIPAGYLTNLLRRAQAGDEPACQDLLVTLHVIVTRAAEARLRDPDVESLVEDVAQEATRRMLRSLPKCRAAHNGAVIRWALAAGRSAAADVIAATVIRAATNADGSGDAVDRLGEGGGEVETGEEAGPLMTLLHDVIDAAPPDVHHLLSLRVIEGEGWTEVGRQLDIGPDAARRRWQRWRARARREIVRRAEMLPAGERAAVERMLGVTLQAGDQ